MNKNIGIMQGRLSPIINGKIQSFPIDMWRNEIKLAAHNDFKILEWTLDYSHFYENPLLSPIEWKNIVVLMKENNFQIPSLTCDFMMERPFWKMNNQENISKLADDLILSLMN